MKSKLTLCDNFKNELERYGINYERHSQYHFQVQRIHNFYPSTNGYYNSETGEKTTIPDFESGDDILMFLGNHTPEIKIEKPPYYETWEQEDKHKKPLYAFACVDSEKRYLQEGMTLRDYFAAQALNGLIAHLVGLKGKDVKDYAKRSYQYADAMLKQREL